MYMYSYTYFYIRVCSRFGKRYLCIVVYIHIGVQIDKQRTMHSHTSDGDIGNVSSSVQLFDKCMLIHKRWSSLV
jgi:hypothetical protein